MVIAIDGPAGVGKTTISKAVAEREGFFFVSSGEIYRAITFLAVKSDQTPPFSGEVLVSLILEAQLALGEDGKVTLKGKILPAHSLHNVEIDALVSTVAGLLEVRSWVNQTLRDWSLGRNIVVEGRDMSTTVFPQADLKVFLDASLEARTSRRAGERTEADQSKIEEAIRTRDAHDQKNLSETFSSSEDSLYLDTSGLTILEVCETIFNKINKLVSK